MSEATTNETIELIENILETYGISKRSMSLLLGWGEHTVSRYLDGEKPSQRMFEVLKSIANDPHVFLKIAKSNKERLGSTKAYDKIERKINGNPFDNIISGDVLNAFVYLSRTCEGITSEEIGFAMFYYLGFRSAFYGEKPYDSFPFCTTTKITSWERLNARYDTGEYQKAFELFNVQLSKKDKVLLDNIVRYFLCYSQRILRKFIASVSMLDSSLTEDVNIDNAIVCDHFSAITKKYKMLMPSDIRLYAEDLFKTTV